MQAKSIVIVQFNGTNDIEEHSQKKNQIERNQDRKGVKSKVKVTKARKLYVNCDACAVALQI